MRVQPSTLTDWLRSLHMWTGLFNLTALIVFALTGILAALPQTEAPTGDVRVIDYQPPEGLTDKEVADAVFAQLGIPVAGPVVDSEIRRDDNNVLAFRFWGSNGSYVVSVLESEKRARVEHVRSTLGEFLGTMHSTSVLGGLPDLRLKLWGLYVDVAVCSLLFMTLTGPWLWLSSRPRLWWAWASMLGGIGSVAALWLFTR